MYILKDFMNEPIKGNLHEPELQKLRRTRMLYGSLKRN
jgi:hypothetical protein